MLLMWSAVRGAALCLVFGGLAFSQIEPLCQNKACGHGVCRVVETCHAANSCTVTAKCFPARYDSYNAGGCRVGRALLKSMANGQYDVRTCYTGYSCPAGFYCSAELQDVSSRCCRANLEPLTRSGACRAPEQLETIFCVDQCLSDADCWGPLKCCPRSQSCQQRYCTSPDPCSLKNCPPGSRCVLDPHYNAHCLPTPTDSVTTAPPPSLPLGPANNNNNNNNIGNPDRVSVPGFRNRWEGPSLYRYRWNGFPAVRNPFSDVPLVRSRWDSTPVIMNRHRGSAPACPHLLTPVRWDTDCHVGNQCVIADPSSCPPSTACCPSYYCGFICRSLVGK